MMVFGGLTVPLGPVEAVLRDVLAASVARDPCENMDEVISEIEAHRAMAWLISDNLQIHGAVVTKIIPYDGGKQCFVWHLGGSGIKKWLHYLDLIEEWARQEGCDSIEAIGRPGLERLLGWQRKAVIIGKAL